MGFPWAAKSRVAMPSIPFLAGGASAAGRGGGNQGLSAWKSRQSCCPGDRAALPTTVGIFPACFMAVIGPGPAFLLALSRHRGPARHAPEPSPGHLPRSTHQLQRCRLPHLWLPPQQAPIPGCGEDAEEGIFLHLSPVFPFLKGVLGWGSVNLQTSCSINILSQKNKN